MVETSLSHFKYILDFFCQKATISRKNEVHKLYFDGHSKEAIDFTAHTFAFMAYNNTMLRVKSLFRIHSNMSISYNKTGWFVGIVSQYGKKEVLNELAEKGTHVFHKNRHSFSSTTRFDTMRSLLYMILQLVMNYFNDIIKSGTELFCNKKLVHRKSIWHWNLCFEHAGSKGSGFDIEVKVSKFLYDVEGE
jgi:hypothetical protein